MIVLAGESFGGIKILDAAELLIAALLEIEIKGISRFAAALLARDHAQIDAARAAGQRLRIVGNRRQPVDLLCSGGTRGPKTLREKAWLVSGHDFGNGGTEIDRVHKDRAEALHVGERLIANADIFAIGNRRLDHEVAHHPEPL